MKKKLLIIGIAGTIGLAGTGIGVYAYGVDNAFELKTDNVDVELGDELSQNMEDYITGGKKALAGASLDISNVDTLNVGTYQAYVAYGKKKLSFSVNVEDTIAPEVELQNKGEVQIVAGETLSGNDIVAKMEDLSGISNVTFSDAVTVEKGEKDLLSALTLSYDTEGTYHNTLTVTDNNGNSTTKDITIHVVEDYAKHVSGFHDWTVEQNADIDFTQGIETDGRIASVTTGTIDLSQTGDYTLVYRITGDDNETVVEHTVNVTVVDASTAQTMANNNETVYISGNAAKAKEVKKAASSGSTASNNSAAGSSASSAASSDNSASSTSASATDNASSGDSESHFYDNWEVGTTIDTGESIGSSTSSDGCTWYAYDSVEIP